MSFSRRGTAPLLLGAELPPRLAVRPTRNRWSGRTHPLIRGCMTKPLHHSASLSSLFTTSTTNSNEKTHVVRSDLLFPFAHSRRNSKNESLHLSDACKRASLLRKYIENAAFRFFSPSLISRQPPLFPLSHRDAMNIA